MSEFDLESALNDCSKSASEGYLNASVQYENLKRVLNDAVDMLAKTQMEFEHSPYRIPGFSDMLSQQLENIQRKFNTINSESELELERLKASLSRFSITLFGRTMAGKSTLMEILKHGNGESIGKGAQRTTKDVRKYIWNDLEIIDVPGIGAFEGKEDEDLAFNSAKTSDLIIFLISDDAPQQTEAECLSKLVALGKPILCLINVKQALSETENISLIQRRIEKKFDTPRLYEMKRQFQAFAPKFGQNWDNIPFIHAHLKSAFVAQSQTDPERAFTLNQLSRIEDLKNKLIDVVRTRGTLYRFKTFNDMASNRILEIIDFLYQQSSQTYKQSQQSKTRIEELNHWKTKFIDDCQHTINAYISTLNSELRSEVPDFSEAHYNDSDACNKWNQLVQEKKINENSQGLMIRFEKELNRHLEEFFTRIIQENHYHIPYIENDTLKGDSVFDTKSLSTWITAIGGAITLLSGPIGWTMVGVGFLGGH